MKVLCMDDEPLALRLIVSILQKMPGIQVCCFDTASDALACAKTESFDFAFLDIMVGGADGTDFAQSLHELQPQCRIIFCTGYPQYAIEDMGCKNVDGYLLKPVEERKIQDILDRYWK